MYVVHEVEKGKSGGFIRCGAATREWLPHRPIIVAVSINERQIPVSSDAAI